MPFIVGLGHACRIAAERLAQDSRRLETLRERLWQGLSAAVPGLRRLGGAQTLPNTLNVLFPDAVGNDLLAATPAIAASTGSACHAGDSKPSAIVLALGIPAQEALGAVRLTLGRGTTEAEIDTAVAALATAHRAGGRA